MTKISISHWKRKPNRPRYYVTSGRESLGTIYERRGIFTSITSDGNLIAASSSLRNAANALTTVSS